MGLDGDAVRTGYSEREKHEFDLSDEKELTGVNGTGDLFYFLFFLDWS